MRNKKRIKFSFLIVILIFALVSASCAGNAEEEQPPISGALPDPSLPHINSDVFSLIFVEKTTGIDDGVQRLVNSMSSQGIYFHRTSDVPYGLIAADDVVILKINAQWDERGGTNTDLIRGVVQTILGHPEGFNGEIIVADNGQAQFGSAGRGGSLDWENNNAIDTSQSVMSVVRDFQAEGYHVTGVLWDEFTRVQVSKFSEGDYTDGFVAEDFTRPTGLEITYPKFTTEFGTHVSFREGIWNPADQSYNSERLKVINMPVLKSHGLFQVTGAVKNYMGTPSDFLTNGRAHNSTGTGGMGTQMAHTRMPVLNIMDMIWIGTERGPASLYRTATQMDSIAASTDPVALDWWAARYILIPEVARLPGGRHVAMDPDGDHPGTFGHWLRLSMSEMQDAGFAFTMNPANMLVIDNR